MLSLNFKKNPITTVVGFLLIAVGVLPFLLPGRVTPDEADQFATHAAVGVDPARVPVYDDPFLGCQLLLRVFGQAALAL